MDDGVLKRLEERVNCGICHGLLNTAMMTPCSHNFCSLCIRKHLTKTSRCPLCQQPIVVRELRNNRIVDEIVSMVETLKKKKKKSEESPEEDELQQPGPSRKRVKDAEKPVVFASTSVQEEIRPESPEITEVASSLPVNDSGKPGPSRVMPEPEPGHVACPVCARQVAERDINLHLDRCLSTGDRRTTSASSPSNAFALMKGPGPSTSSSSSVASPFDGTPKRGNGAKEPGGKRRPLAKLVYSIMSDKELRKQCRKLGLNDKGDKRTLQERHQRFTLLYNADCDRLRPTPVAELIQQVEKEERDLKEAAQPKPSTSSGASSSSSSSSARPDILALDHNADLKTVQKARKQYLKKHDPHFQELIDEVRARMMNSKKNLAEEKEEEAVPEVVFEEQREQRKSALKSPAGSSANKKKVQFNSQPDIVDPSQTSQSSDGPLVLDKSVVQQEEEDEEEEEKPNLDDSDMDLFADSEEIPPPAAEEQIKPNENQPPSQASSVFSDIPCGQVLPPIEEIESSPFLPPIILQEPTPSRASKRRNQPKAKKKPEKKDEEEDFVPQEEEDEDEEDDDDFVEIAPKRPKRQANKKKASPKRTKEVDRILKETFENVGSEAFENSLSAGRPRRTVKKS